MLQIGQIRGGFIYTTPKIVVPNIATLFKNPSACIDGISEKDLENVYFTLAHHSGWKDAGLPQRLISTFEYQTVMPFDVDHCDTARIFDYAAIFAEVLQVPKDHFILVNSGNGMHCYVQLKHPLHSAAFFKEMRPYYNEILGRLTKRFEQEGLPGKADPAVFDAARVMRLPNTWNVKKHKETGEITRKMCSLVQYSDSVHDLDLKEISGLADFEKQNISPKDVKRQFPRPDFPEIMKECRFASWVTGNPDKASEPVVFDLFSLLAVMPPDSSVDTFSPEEIARKVFNNATGSKSLAKDSFEEKWEQGSKYGARKCETINQTWGKCSECPHYGKISTPLALKSKTHLSSEANGFWVLNAKGNPMHPHYQDLAQVYFEKNKAVATPDGRVFSFNGMFFTETLSLLIKRWAEENVNPTEPLREFHRVEFVNKVKVLSSITEGQVDSLFNTSVDGMLNCQNGILDIVKGEVIPHSHEYGFKYVLPYSLNLGEVSDIFIEWLSKICLDRVETMEALLDVMAYSIWPGYEDHSLIFFVGDGSNGKSTLIHVMEAIVGHKNFSSVNIQQLTSNRFAPAALEGKLVNLSEESSGSELDIEQLNILKNLSSGGDSHIERKGQDGYSFKNRAKLIFSANKIPKFRDNGEAVKRRLLVIPFDYKIVDRDSRVESDLISDAPKIMSMLVRRAKENVAKNGRFVLNRGGMFSEKAQANFLTSGNNVKEWAEERIESSSDFSDDDFIRTSEAYNNYKLWCDETGQKYTEPLKRFSNFIRDHVLTKGVIKTDQQRIGHEKVRVFRKTKWLKETEWVK